MYNIVKETTTTERPLRLTCQTIVGYFCSNLVHTYYINFSDSFIPFIFTSKNQKFKQKQFDIDFPTSNSFFLSLTSTSV